jgi:hypothetical protein
MLRCGAQLRLHGATERGKRSFRRASVARGDEQEGQDGQRFHAQRTVVRNHNALTLRELPTISGVVTRGPEKNGGVRLPGRFVYSRRASYAQPNGKGAMPWRWLDFQAEAHLMTSGLTSAQSVPWWLGTKERRSFMEDWMLELPAQVEGTFTGTLATRRTRTWAGCSMMPDEEQHYPELLLLVAPAPEPICAPLKPLLPGRRAALLASIAEGRRLNDPYGPPYAVAEDPWFSPSMLGQLGLRVGDRVSVQGVAYPMFSTGTYGSFEVFGFYVEAMTRA